MTSGPGSDPSLAQEIDRVLTDPCYVRLFDFFNCFFIFLIGAFKVFSVRESIGVSVDFVENVLEGTQCRFVDGLLEKGPYTVAARNTAVRLYDLTRSVLAVGNRCVEASEQATVTAERDTRTQGGHEADRRVCSSAC